MRVDVWLSGESPALGRAEALAVAALAGGSPSLDEEGTPDTVSLELPSSEAARWLTDRVALAHRAVRPWEERTEAALRHRLEREGGSVAPVAIRWRPGTPDPDGAVVRALGAAYRSGGGRIGLDRPARVVWLWRSPTGEVRAGEEVSRVDRAAFSRRRTPRLPFQRPVTLAPRLARALVNLARVRAGDRVVDPFAGTGSLLAEAMLVRARGTGVDRSASMVRGTLRNLEFLGLTADALRQADAAEAAAGFDDGAFDALVTDPPYGRASSAHGEPVEALWTRALSAWVPKVRDGGRVALVFPAGSGPELPGLVRELSVGVRVHRSLTREFRVYRRAAAPAQ